MPQHVFATPIGDCTAWWEGDRLTGFHLPPVNETPAAPGPPTPLPEWVVALVARVRAHLSGGSQDFSNLPYAWERVSDFQRSVYLAALRVSPGQTATYGQLAATIGHRPGASRAIGTALGQNPWPLLIPCHRFVGADGRMTGFSAPGGITTKLRLLAIEGAQLFDV